MQIKIKSHHKVSVLVLDSMVLSKMEKANVSILDLILDESSLMEHLTGNEAHHFRVMNDYAILHYFGNITAPGTGSKISNKFLRMLNFVNPYQTLKDVFSEIRMVAIRFLATLRIYDPSSDCYHNVFVITNAPCKIPGAKSVDLTLSPNVLLTLLEEAFLLKAQDEDHLKMSLDKYKNPDLEFLANSINVLKLERRLN